MKILVTIANYGTQNDQYLERVLGEYRAMPYEIRFIVVSNLEKDFGPDVEVRVGLPSKDPWSLPFAHKPIFGDKRDEYDLFIYSEDDHLITVENIDAFLKASSVVGEDELPGFIVVESDADGNANYCGVHTNFHWEPKSVRSVGEYTFAEFTNEHSACYLLTQAQLKKAIDSGGFLVPPHDGKFDLPCTASTDPYRQCGFKKVVCISDLGAFTVRHLTNKYVGRLGISQKDMDRQIEALREIEAGKRPVFELMQTETRLPGQRWSKNYYEAPDPGVLREIPAGAKAILSVGCGSGWAESALVKRGARVVGIPLDSVIAASAEAVGVEVVYRSLERAFEELPGGPFDCVLLPNVLHLIDEPARLIARSHKVLSPSGKIVATVPNLSRIPVLAGRLTGDRRYRLLGDAAKAGVHVTSKSIVQRWFKSAACRVEKVIDVQAAEMTKAKKIMALVLDGQFASDFIVVASGNRPL